MFYTFCLGGGGNRNESCSTRKVFCVNTTNIMYHQMLSYSFVWFILGHTNFIVKILNFVREEEEIKVVADCVCYPGGESGPSEGRG